VELARLAGDWAGGGSRSAGLAEVVASAIAEGRLPPGVRLPAERTLATQLGVSRNTVVAAYDRLRQGGLVRTRQGSGTVVGGPGEPGAGPREARMARTLLPNGIFDGVLGTDEGGTDLRAAYWVGADELPPGAFALDEVGVRDLVGGHGYSPAGIAGLREAFAARLTSRGLATAADQVIVTSGAQQALSLVVHYVVDPGDRVLVEDPTYPGMIEALLAAGADVGGVPRSRQGLDLAALRTQLARRAPRLVYLLPTVHNPLGTTIPGPDRALLVRALRPAPLVVEDLTLADTELRPTGWRPLAADAERDGGPPVITVGSLSKSMWGGLRVGWLRGPRALVQRLTRMKAIHDIGSSIPSQVIALRLLAHEAEITERRRQAVARRLAALQSLLDEQLPGWTWQEPTGGLSLWVRIGEVSAIDFAAFATRYGVAVAPGPLSSPTASHCDHLRLPYGQPVPVLEAGVARLAAAWRDYTRRLRPSDAVSVVL